MRAIWFVPPAVHLVACRRGLLEQSGVVVETVATTSSDEQFDALVTGRVDVAITAMDNVMGWNGRGAGDDFRIVAQIESTTSLSVFATPQVAAPEDLAGRDVLVDSRHNGFVIALLNWLSDVGLDLERINLVESGGVRERLDALVSGAGDATLLGPPFDVMALAQGMLRLASLNEVYPDFPGQGIVLRTGAIDRFRGELQQWIRALEAAGRFGRASRSDAQADIEASGFPAPAAAAMAAGIPATLRPDPKGLALLVAQRARLGLSGGAGKASDLVYADLLDEIRD